MIAPYLAPRPIAFAHRGGAALWPENTLESFAGAIALGYRYLETDLHMTADGAIVCFHDATLERTTDGYGPLRARRLRDLRRLDAGYRFTSDGRSHPFRGRGITVPTLEEVLALHPEVRLNVEIKQRQPPMERALAAEIERLGAHERLLIAAEYDPLALRFRALQRSAAIPISAGFRGVLAFYGAVRAGVARRMKWPFEALQVPARHAGLTVVDRAFVESAHACELRVHVWTIDEPQEMHRLLDLGVDGVMTDRPDLLREVMRERGAWPADESERSRAEP